MLSSYRLSRETEDKREIFAEPRNRLATVNV
jgi:hypothetical protein